MFSMSMPMSSDLMYSLSVREQWKDEFSMQSVKDAYILYGVPSLSS